MNGKFMTLFSQLNLGLQNGYLNNNQNKASKSLKFASFSPVNFSPSFKSEQNKLLDTSSKDMFVRSSNVSDIYQQKLSKLFPKGSLEKIYSQMAKELGIDILPDLKFYGPSDGKSAGGYTFNKNEISFSLEEIFDNNYKVVMVKNGMYKNLTSPNCNMPLFINKSSGEKFVEAQRPHFKKFVDDIILIPMTENDIRKFVIHKMYHELIHAQQHMIMRSTEGIGEKEVIKAWTHLIPENDKDVKELNDVTEKIYKDSFWSNKPATKAKYKKDSEMGKLAYAWLEAVRKYPPPDSPEYNTNAIEVDAFKRSYQYLVKTLGSY